MVPVTVVLGGRTEAVRKAVDAAVGGDERVIDVAELIVLIVVPDVMLEVTTGVTPGLLAMP